MAITRVKLSGSTDGKGIKVTGTTTGTSVTVHTAHATNLDSLRLYAYNDNASDAVLTIEYGGTTDPDHVITQTIPAASGLVQVLNDDLVLSNSLVVKAFATVANMIVLYGSVLRDG